MKRLFAFMLCTIILILTQTSAFAVGDGNIDSGGGNLNPALDGYYWTGLDGVRVTIIKDSDNRVVSTPIDLTNVYPGNIQIQFGKVSKMQYRNGSGLTPETETYTFKYPLLPIPKIISSDGTVNITAIKNYFTDELVIRYVAESVSFNYDQLINGNYKLLLEPIAYFTVGGIMVAMTAHEAALYDQLIGGTLRNYMPSLTHKNLPLAMFLETSDLGFPAWNGSTTEKVSDEEILSSLGLGVVRFSEPDKPVIPANGEVEYRTDTDVITAVNLKTSNRITPDSSSTVTFNVNGASYTIKDIVIPEGESQVVWVKWHTPRNPATITVTASSNKGTLNISRVIAKVVDLREKLPPNPSATDVKPNGYTIPALPSMEQNASAAWGVWNCYWKANWIWESSWNWISDGEGGGNWVDNGRWVDCGDWQYTYTSYYASLAANMDIMPDAKVPTAAGKIMRSGYGINLNVSTLLQSNAPASAITGAQNILSYYPEFSYSTYLRLSDIITGSYNAVFELKPNEFSTYGRRVHFTPIWYPDGRYTPMARVIDVWTPAGMLSCNLSDYVNIQGSLYDDWHITPKR